MTTHNILLVVAAFTTALMAGLFYSYSCSVNPGLSKLGDAEYLTAMKSINRSILNPVFFAAFFGALITLPLNAYLNYSISTRFWFLAAATIFYALGLFGVTLFGNVPLNETLDRFVIAESSGKELAAMREVFEKPWNRLHLIRTISAIISLVLVLIACVLPDYGNAEPKGL